MAFILLFTSTMRVKCGINLLGVISVSSLNVKIVYDWALFLKGVYDWGPLVYFELTIFLSSHRLMTSLMCRLDYSRLTILKIKKIGDPNNWAKAVAQIQNIFGFQIVQSCLVGEWFSFWTVGTFLDAFCILMYWLCFRRVFLNGPF